MRTRDAKKYKNLVCAFDIETTRIGDNAVMYMWQIAIDEYTTLIGRTWEEFLNFIEACVQRLGEDESLVFYVHNLSFEFAFLAGIYHFLPEEVFAVKPRRILKATMYDKHIEFRCSYLHSNMSLKAFGDAMNIKDTKLSGAKFDYNKKRYWFTPLTDFEMQYAIHDVTGLVQAIKTEMQRDGDNLYTIPLTSTGYVRRDVRAAMNSKHKLIQSLFPSEELYTLLRKAFRGGNTHANRYFVGSIIDNVHSVDRSSSYPETQLNHKFPMSQFKEVETDYTESELVRLRERDIAFVATIKFYNVQLTDDLWGCPYLSKDKCQNITNGIYDNGRILSADYFETTVTDVDFDIIMNEYDIDGVEIVKMFTSKYGELPEELKEVIRQYYRGKTELKDIVEKEYYYMKSKNKLNSVYGMSAQDPVKDSILFLDGEYKPEGKTVAELLVNSRKGAYIVYQWGVWCTAWARWELEEMIKAVHNTDGAEFIYTDTDSVKYTGDIEQSLDAYNKAKIEQSTKNNAYATDKHGVTHYMGVYEKEKDYKRFVTWGAKKYAYEYDKPKKVIIDDEPVELSVHITLAGVPKLKGALELQQAGGLEKFVPGFMFDAGKMESVYNDVSRETILIDGHAVEITPNVCLRPTTYLLSITQEYSDILDECSLYRIAAGRILCL